MESLYGLPRDASECRRIGCPGSRKQKGGNEAQTKELEAHGGMFRPVSLTSEVELLSYAAVLH